MEAVNEIVHMNRLLEVEELAFQSQLEDALSLFTFFSHPHFCFGSPSLFSLPVLICTFVDRDFLTPASV